MRVLAQAPPRPNVTATNRLPSLVVNVFPADFNKDGRTDLVASTDGGFGRAGTLEVRYGTGTGEFGAAVRPALPRMVPLGVGDFNNDTRTDILAYHVQYKEGVLESQAVMIVPGTASGFGSPVTVDVPIMPGDFLATVITDFDGDGDRDFAYAGWDDTVYVFPGNGDFTFDPARSLPTGEYARSAVAADLNNDNRPDMAFTSEYGRRIDVFINQGGFAFAPTIIPLDRSGLGITAWDINGDGRRDLLVGSGDFDLSPYHWSDGFLNVLLGTGNGTFAPAVKIPTLPGPVAVVAGDFNRDGRIDVATANQSNQHNVGCDGTGYLFSSVSILPGLGNGSFGSAASFSLGFDQQAHDPYRTVTGLRTNDVNRDGHADLITSPGLTLINTAPAGNRPPVANAGPDQQFTPSYDVFLQGSGVDPDTDWLTYQWTDESGRVVSNQPQTCLKEGYSTPQQTFTLTVTDGRGGVSQDRMTVNFNYDDYVNPRPWIARPADGELVALNQPYVIRFDSVANAPIRHYDLDFSPDGGDTWAPIPECTGIPGAFKTCTWRKPAPLTSRAMVRVWATDEDGHEGFGTSPFFSIVTDASGPGGLPPGWSSGDVGQVAASGSASYANGTFTVRGSGADVWDRADEFHFARQRIAGDFSITARVASVENVNAWTKAGLMLRTFTGAGAMHAFAIATPSTVKGLAFQRRTQEGGLSSHTAGPAMAAPVWLKLTRTGDRITTYYRKLVTDPWRVIGTDVIPGLYPELLVGLAVSSHVDGRVATATFDNVRIEPVPAFTSADIGAVGVAGTTSATDDAVAVTLGGSGADIWGTADAFRYHYARWFGDGTITVRVRSVENTNAWAKAGVMFRQSTSRGSRHVMALVSPGKGLALQYRPQDGQASAQAANKPGTAPEWIRLTRLGNTFSAATSEDGVTWQALGSVTVDMPMDALVGVMVTSHNNSARATATFEEVRVSP